MPRGICLYDGCGATARLYPGGWLCEQHGPPAPPSPPPGTTAAEIRAAHQRRPDMLGLSRTTTRTTDPRRSP